MPASFAQSIYNSVPEKSYLGLSDQSGPKYKEIMGFLHFKKDDLSKATGIEKNSIRDDDRMSAELTDRLLEIANVCELVAEYFKGDIEKTALWFKIANPMLGNLSPRDMIRLGRFKKLQKFIYEARQGL